MAAPPLLVFETPWPMLVTAGVALVAVVLGWRAAMPLTSRLLAVGSLLLLVLAAGTPHVRREVRPRLAIVLDVSPSTRGAVWRDPAWVRGLVDHARGFADVELFSLAEGTQAMTLEAYTGTDMLASSTRLVPPEGRFDRHLVLTDGRIDVAEGMANVTLAIDPVLLTPRDAAVTRIVADGDDVAVAARSGFDADVPLLLGNHERRFTGSALVRLPGSEDEPTIARVVANDTWPENDLLRMPPIVLEVGRRLWMGESSAPTGFEPLDPPLDDAELAAAAVVVLENVPASALGAADHAVLQRYVTELGGTLILLGGDRAFAAGNYPGTALEAVSPLSSLPPAPRARWVLLADASGSMASSAGGQSRFVTAIEALRQVSLVLPEASPVEVGAFAEGLTWWARSVPAAEISTLRLPPAGASAGGPTNLAVALRQIASELPQSPLPTQVLVLTDAQVPMEETVDLAETLRRAGITLNVVNVGEKESEALAGLVGATGGRLVSAGDPERWDAAAEEVARAAAGDPVVQGSAVLEWRGELSALRPQRVESWNRTWPREASLPLLETGMGDAAEAPLAAHWQLGLGRVAAIGFALPPEVAADIAQRLESRPAREGTFVEWEEGTTLRVRVRAPGAGSVQLQRAGRQFRGTRIAPELWEVRVPAPRDPAIAAVVVDGRVVERFASAGRYAPEFELEAGSIDAIQTRFAPQAVEVIALDGLSAWRPKRRFNQIGLLAPTALLATSFGAAALVVWRQRAGG